MWEKTWTADKTWFGSFRLKVGDESWFVRFSRGRKRTSVTVRPSERFVFDVEGLSGVVKERLRDVNRALNVFAREYGFGFKGELRESDAPEFGMQAPGIAPFGSPGVSTVWLDRSRGAEVETRSLTHAESFLVLPKHIQETRERLLSVRDGILEVDRRLADRLSLAEETLGVVADVLKKLAAPVERVVPVEVPVRVVSERETDWV